MAGNDTPTGPIHHTSQVAETLRKQSGVTDDWDNVTCQPCLKKRPTEDDGDPVSDLIHFNRYATMHTGVLWPDSQRTEEWSKVTCEVCLGWRPLVHDPDAPCGALTCCGPEGVLTVGALSLDTNPELVTCPLCIAARPVQEYATLSAEISVPPQPTEALRQELSEGNLRAATEIALDNLPSIDVTRLTSVTIDTTNIDRLYIELTQEN